MKLLTIVVLVGLIIYVGLHLFAYQDVIVPYARFISGG